MPGLQDTIAEKLLDLVNSNYQTRRLPNFYAAALGQTVRKLNAASKKATGKLVTELITEQLLAEAERLLAESALSIKEIAYELDFADMAQFNHFMKRHTGHSPTAYRQMARKDN